MGKTASVTIAPLVREDLNQVLQIEQASFSAPWSRNLFLSEFRNKPVSLMLAAHAGSGHRDVAGYIVCWVVADELHILDLATRPDLRRHGIARQLLIAVLRMACERGIRKAYLEVRESNRAALRLYESFGFRRSQVREEYYDHPVENAVVMVLENEVLRKSLGSCKRS